LKKYTKYIITLLFLLVKVGLMAQSPQAFKYQAVVRDNAGNVVVNKLISIKSSILIDSLNGNSVYAETHSLATNDFGIVNLSIGKGTILSGNFNSISWGGHNYFIKTEVDFNGGSNYQYLGTSQLLSVPYALYAEKSGTSGADNDNQTLSINGNNLSISNGNTVAIPADNDSDPTNELQALSISNDTLYLSNGNKVYLGAFKDNTDNQQLTLNGNQLQISGGNSITLSGAVDLDSDPTNELQILTKSNDTLYLTNGGYVVFNTDNDKDSLNELQVLNKSGDTLFLSKGNYVIFDQDLDKDSLNEIQSLSISNDSIYISKSNSIKIPTSLDNDTLNEIQTLTFNNDTLSISKGNSIPLSLSSNRFTPIGSIISYGGRTIPDGWLLCDGSELDRIIYSGLFSAIDTVWGRGNGSTTFNLPDLRGQFLRGVDGSAGVDPDKSSRYAKISGGNTGNNPGSYQNEDFKSHTHNTNNGQAVSGGYGYKFATTSQQTMGSAQIENSGGNETRPKNAYVYYIIKK
jgi:microcystin-dependent protein